MRGQAKGQSYEPFGRDMPKNWHDLYFWNLTPKNSNKIKGGTNHQGHSGTKGGQPIQAVIRTRAEFLERKKARQKAVRLFL